MWQIFIIICSDVVEDRLIDSTNRKFFNQSFFFFLNKAFSVSRQLSSFSQVIIPVQNGRMKIIQWNYSRLATIAWAKQECNDYYSIFHLFAHVGLGVLLNDPFGESIASISIPLSLSLSFDLSLPNQKKFLNRSIGECRAARVMDRFPISKSKYETRWNALISSVQVFVSMNVPQILTPWQTPSRDYVIIET